MSTFSQRALLASGVAALAAGLALAAAQAPIRAANWLAPSADPVRALTTQPTECLRLPRDPASRQRVEIGRAAFRTPVLLGGQAARAGLACETCHRGGRTNPDFRFPGVSGAPGTADVTQSIFSTHRGDGVDNPVPIPDLSGPKSRLKVDQAQDSRALEGFIHGLVVEEFDGPEPSPAVLQGLAAYVRALAPDNCPRTPREPLDVRSLMNDARRAIAAARAASAQSDRSASILMLASARSRLGLIDERFAADPRFAPLRTRLRSASERLAAAQDALRIGAAPPDADFDRWLADSRRLETDLATAEPGSLFAPAQLQAAMTRRLPR